MTGDFLYSQGHLTECSKCRHFPSNDPSKAIFSLQTFKRMGGQDAKGRHVWGGRGQCRHFGKKMCSRAQEEAACFELAVFGVQKPLWWQEFNSEVSFTCCPGPPPRAVSEPRLPPRCAPCRACTVSAGAQDIFVSITEGQDLLLPTCLPPYRTDVTGHSGRAVLTLGFWAQTCERGERIYEAGKQGRFCHLRYKQSPGLGRLEQGNLKGTRRPRLPSCGVVYTQVQRAAGPKEKGQEERKTATAWW